MSSTRLRVKELLRERRWTTKVLAEKTGMSESYLTHIKNGTRRWNEDALKRLADAFKLEPTDLFAYRYGQGNLAEQAIEMVDDNNTEEFTRLLKMKIVPVVGKIPSTPSPFENQQIQVETGYADSFVPVFSSDDNDMFCLQIEDVNLAPRFNKGDQLVISPAVWSRSGDIVAVEFSQDDELKRQIMQVNYMDDFVVLESVNHQQAPIALVRGKDPFRIIGKVIWRYQKL